METVAKAGITETWGLETDEVPGVHGFVLSTATTADKLWKEYEKRERRKPRGPRCHRNTSDGPQEADSSPAAQKASPSPSPSPGPEMVPVAARAPVARDRDGPAARGSGCVEHPHFLHHDRVRGDLGGAHPYASYYGHSYEERACGRSTGRASYVQHMVAATTQDMGAVYTKPMQGFSPTLMSKYKDVHRKYDEIWKSQQWSKYDLCHNGPYY
eukprot:TRINITY_DN4113_c0_g1_i1.p1 TRINITY_DN4113_c0_g1~~TRINITY_DN4113_c0_g1_i1.p1  ORF type:complete len:213 (-),score=35.14 TRINITY_DN4113_c0_g1_i1:194-832(-)